MADLTNQIFDDMKVIRFDDTKGKYKYYYICECMYCHKQKSIAYNSITHHIGTTCCNKKKIESKGYANDITNQIFGDLTVESFAYSKYSHSYWNCICKCGNRIIKPINVLRKCNKQKVCCKECLKDYLAEIHIKPNNVVTDGDITIINDKLIIDTKNLDKILSYNKYIQVNNSGYAFIDINHKEYFIHRMILDLPQDYDNVTQLIGEHINGNRLDCREENLRICKKSKNPMNCKIYKNNTSGCKGVTWMERLNKWQVVINVNKKSIYLGIYSDYNEAVKIRKEAELKYYKDFRRAEEYE